MDVHGTLRSPRETKLRELKVFFRATLSSRKIPVHDMQLFKDHWMIFRDQGSEGHELERDLAKGREFSLEGFSHSL